MARKLRVHYEGAIYHLTMRGVARRRLFDEESEQERFVQRLGEAAEEHGVRIYLFCLMRNHVHLVAETPGGNVSAFMHKLQTAYTVFYNRRHRRVGHLMQGRFGAQAVQGDEYLLRLTRYVHLNPVFVGSLRGESLEVRREVLRRYRWSSYRGYAGLAPPYGFVQEGPLLALVEGAEAQKREAYRQYVEAGLAETDRAFAKLIETSAWGIGDEAFQAQRRDQHTDLALQVRRPEDVSFRQVAPRVSASAVVTEVAAEFGLEAESLRHRQYGCVARAVCALLLVRCSGMTQRDVAAFLGMGTGAAVCQQLQGLRIRLGTETGLAERIEHVRHRLESAAFPDKSPDS